MRRLIVMRHAKSSWTSGASSDHARPLNKRGRRDAVRIAEKLVELDWLPERVLSSDSMRTRETWARMAPLLDDEIEVDFTRRLYHGDLGELAEQVAELGQAQSLLVLGHNPGWEHAVSWLSGQEHTMTTANAALLACDVEEWAGSFDAPGRWDLRAMLRPKEL